jgi:peptidoglycan hydrolase-like protein with peptidoglycan-binding domain
VLARRILLVCAVFAVLGTAVWDSQRGSELASTSKATVPSTSTQAAPGVVDPSTTTGSTAPPPATAPRVPRPPAPPPPGLGIGARGPEVLALEQRLATLHYDVGPVDGVYDGNTAFAVVAFQKVTCTSRTSRATDDVLAAVQTAADPPPLVPGGGAARVEVDVGRQVLFLYQDDTLYKILPVSTGSGARYCVDGSCARAVTPAGSYKVFLRVRGWQTSRLGRLYNPLYFNGGIAIHGAPSVPASPTSHGCVRIPMSAAEWFPSKVASGTPVYVKNGPAAPVPFNQPAPDGTPPASPPATTAPPPPPTTTSSSSTTSTTTGGGVL